MIYLSHSSMNCYFLIALLLSLFCWDSIASETAEEAQLPVTNIVDIRSMPRDRLAKNPIVRVHGIITYVDGYENHAMAVADDTMGIYLQTPQALKILVYNNGAKQPITA